MSGEVGKDFLFRKKAICEESFVIFFSFWILLYKNMMFRFMVVICGYDEKRNWREKDLEYWELGYELKNFGIIFF